MQVITHPNASSFLEQNRTFLEERESENNLLLGLAETLSKNPLAYSRTVPFYWSVIHEGQSVLCGLQTPPKNLITYGLEQYIEEATNHFAQYLQEEAYAVPGVVGPKYVALHLSQSWSRLNKVSFKEKMAMGVYRLDEVAPIAYSEGALRLATMDDLALVSHWIYEFYQVVLTPVSEDEARGMAEKRIPKREIYIWENEQPVSMASSARPTRQGCAVNLVYTPSTFRGKGYASTCVAALSQKLLERYQFCSLFTDLKNPTSNKIYQQIGYYRVADFMEYRFEG